MFKRKSGFDGGKKFGGGGFAPRGRGGRDAGGFGTRDAVRPQLHKATCSACSTSCEVPFKPNGSKPIFCRDCFKKEDNGGERSFSRPSASRPSFGDRRPREFASTSATPSDKRIDEINTKLDRILREIVELKELQG